VFQYEDSMITNWLWFAVSDQDPVFLKAGEELLHEMALTIKIFLEFLAIFIVFIACLGAINKIIRSSLRISSRTQLINNLRLNLAHALALSLEFLLAADIVGTAVSPDWEAVGKLGAIAIIRTFLNYFLEKEVEELQKITNHQEELR